MLIRITLAVDDRDLRRRLGSVLARPDILVQTPRVRKGLWPRILKDPCDVLLVGESMLPEPLRAGMEQLLLHPDTPASVVLAESADPVTHARFLADGCDAVLFAGLAEDHVRGVIEAMLEKRQRKSQKLFFATRPLAEPRLSDFVSESPGMARFLNLVPRVVQSDTALLIEGETGVGKERLACAIHTEGRRATGRFVALNCGALPEHLLESELFGHVRGAFTGATAARRGWFEIAHRGTLFLDEVGEIPIHLQVKLLRVLQEQEIQPIGSEKSFGVDVRVIAASNRELQTEVEARRFRRDLYHRLSVVTVTVPPLRERPEDIPVLVERQIAYLAHQVSRHVTGIAPGAMRAMCRYPWPGNVRELNNVIERAILLCDDTEITLSHLPESIADLASGPPGHPVAAPDEAEPPEAPVTSPASGPAGRLALPEVWLTKSLQEVRKSYLADLERQYIEGLLAATRGRIGEAARRAGLQERSLYEKMKQFGLRKEDYRQPSGATG
ncbi:MAG: sigma-54 dependent transcriptional regulator [Planctomycetes bacterium]|jgi:DNA-binding NtrC family response regulator|nr:sigma-54 dependent transcriptional regulator [Planctomycetota bacterium]